MDFLSGVVERITFANEENGFSVIKIKAKGFSDLVTVVGNLASINVGSVINLKGYWKNNVKFGRQFSVDSYTEEIPASVYGIEKYLGSGLIKGIGPKFAKSIVKCFKEKTIEVIDNEPERLMEVEGIGNKRVNIIINAWNDQKEIKNVMIFLQSNGVSTTYAVKIYKQYGADSIKLVRENPYRLADDIWGIGFKTADKIAENLGFEKDSRERAEAGIIYCLNDLTSDGHCYLDKNILEELSIEILEVEKDIILNALQNLIDTKRVIDDDSRIYLPVFYHCEVSVSKRLIEIINSKSNIKIDDFERKIKKIQGRNRIKFDDYQIKAVKKAVESKFMILTGGPGTGKTTTTKAIIELFLCAKARFLLAAPTGRAAKRLAETTNMEAKTIHRLLEFSPAEGYKRNDKNKLDCDVIIIDESSMIDIILMYNLLKAVSLNTVLILIGDVDQLPSVGPGNVLKDLIDSKVLNIAKLEKIFRQAANSTIITNAHKVNKGQFPYLKTNKTSDFFYIEEEDPIKIRDCISNLCKNRLPNYYNVDPIDDIQVLCPMQRGEIGVASLNKELQNTLNDSDTKITYMGNVYKIDDKVMQIKNNYDKNVYNGDIGRISNIDLEDKKVYVMFDDKVVLYDSTELDELVLSYAATIHKSQGSEFKIVVAPFSTQHFMMLQRNLLYTCITRAKSVFILIGTVKAISIAVNNNKVLQRNTYLSERLREEKKLST
jgi:exodeoxyribonuclease V alpha subunit